jgi:pimeloyl-ACP methyl ester carboxylesterase
VVWEKRRNGGIKRALAAEFSKKHKERAFLYKQIRILNEDGPNRLQTEHQVQRLRALERVPDIGASKENLAALPMPVLFIGGEYDEVMPVSLMEIAHGFIPTSRMVTVPGAAHSVYFEMPELFTQVTLDFAKTCLEAPKPAAM